KHQSSVCLISENIINAQSILMNNEDKDNRGGTVALSPYKWMSLWKGKPHSRSKPLDGPLYADK
ncbi:hypothetical protein HispidOSU_007985, partial [Sigmodon hispidus]